MNHLAGLKDLIGFLIFLKQKNVFFALAHYGADSITVTMTLYGERIEIDFFDDHIEYSRFRGDESVLSDQAVLFGLIEDFVRE